MEDWKCKMVRDFIDDHTELALLYSLKQERGDCEEMVEFIEEMQLEGKFAMYLDVRSQMG
jgi:hypothetical protein